MIIQNRCAYVNLNNPRYVSYHDEEWCVPEHSDKKLYELLILECFQAGLSWECILNKRDHFERAYDGFDIEKVCAYDDAQIERLMQDCGIVRNRRKIEASIQNSRVFRGIQREFGSFDAYLWGFAGGEILFEDYHIRTTSPLSDALSKDLKARGMRFVGPTILYSYLQAVGILNAHGPECDLCTRRTGWQT